MSLNDTPSGRRVMIGFFGRRNAGKSSIINAFTNQKLSIVSNIKGTTTDPVYKSMELLPMGPITVVDTPGFDDEGELGLLRIEKCKEVMRRVDVAILVIDGTVGASKEDGALFNELVMRKLPIIIAINKIDVGTNKSQEQLLEELGDFAEIAKIVLVSALSNEGIYSLRETVAHLLDVTDKEIISLLPSFVKTGDVVVLVVPIDASAPKGRLILPQQQVIRECLEKGAIALVCKDSELDQMLSKTSCAPKLVVTDSQVFDFVSKLVPQSVPLTSFSILFSKAKGSLEWQLVGAKALDLLEDGDKVLIAEGCTHHRQCADIGTVKIPRWIESYTGKKIDFDTSSGNDFPDSMALTKYKLVIHCGGCTLNAREMQYRVNECIRNNVPITNYGMLIAKVNGILDRAIASVERE